MNLIAFIYSGIVGNERLHSGIFYNNKFPCYCYTSTSRNLCSILCIVTCVFCLRFPYSRINSVRSRFLYEILRNFIGTNQHEQFQQPSDVISTVNQVRVSIILFCATIIVYLYWCIFTFSLSALLVHHNIFFLQVYKKFDGRQAIFDSQVGLSMYTNIY